MNTEEIQPLNIVAATLIIQLLLYSALFLTSSMYKLKDVKGWMIVSFILTLTILFISEDFSKVWEPLFPGTSIIKLSTVTSINMVFGINIFLTSLLIRQTGGSTKSPFASVLFTIPALSIFLRLPTVSFLVHSVVVGFIFLLFLHSKYEYNDLPFMRRGETYGKIPLAVMSISCLAILTLIGYITRPISIDHLQIDKTSAATSQSVPQKPEIQN